MKKNKLNKLMNQALHIKDKINKLIKELGEEYEKGEDNVKCIDCMKSLNKKD